MVQKTVSLAIDADPLSYYFSRRGISATDRTNINAQYDSSFPRFLDLFDEMGVKATFLLVGRDALRKENHKIIKEIGERGHEVGSHTMTHIRPFALADKVTKKYEIFESKKLLSDICGKEIKGFRGTDYSIDCETLDLLEEAGYLYDCSNYSSFTAPLINLLDLLSYRGRGGSLLVPPPRHGFSPRGPYYPGKKISWLKGKRKVLEIPSTAVPLLGLQYSTPIFLNLGLGMLKFCCWLVDRTRLPLIHTFQGIDLVDYHSEVRDSRLKVIRGMAMPLSEKLAMCREMISIYKERYKVVTMGELARQYG